MIAEVYSQYTIYKTNLYKQWVPDSLLQTIVIYLKNTYNFDFFEPLKSSNGKQLHTIVQYN